MISDLRITPTQHHLLPHERIDSITSASLTAGNLAGAVRATKPKTPNSPSTTQSYTEVAKIVRDQQLLSRTPGFYALVGGGIMLALGGAVTGFILLGDSWFQLLIAAALGLIFTQFAFLAHEASHRAILSSGPANDRLGRFLASGVVGMSYSWWMTKHTRHHANPNKMGKDPDIEFDTISFTEESAAKQTGLLAAITRKQGYLFFPLLTLEGLNLHYTSIKSLCTRRKIDGRWKEFTFIGVRFAIYLTAIFWFLPLGMGFAFLGVQLAVFGVYMGASFAPNHKGMPIIGPDEKLDFFSKQVRTSRNVLGGWWSTALLGGLNYQVEHHLFPSMPRPHLAKTRLIVKEHCERLDVAYTETTLMRSYAIVIAYLNRVGLSARNPFDCPLVTEFRRR